jgi:uncharacterized damage-inducible protein DinB
MVDYRIKRIAGYTDKIGELVSMLEHTRAVTLSDIETLSQHDLDYVSDQGSNSIGSLIMHIAAIEYVHGLITFENRDFNSSEWEKWGPAIELGEKARQKFHGEPLEFYLKELTQVRENTLEQLRHKSDDWLYEENKWSNGVAHNKYYLWFHVMEDEISHRGQIRMMKRSIL